MVNRSEGRFRSTGPQNYFLYLLNNYFRIFDAVSVAAAFGIHANLWSGRLVPVASSLRRLIVRRDQYTIAVAVAAAECCNSTWAGRHCRPTTDA